MSSGVGPNMRSRNAAWMQVAAAETAGARPAVLDGEAVVTHAELRDRALGIAAALAEAGVRPGDRVALLMRRGADAAAAYFGALACGAVAVIVNESLRPRQIEYVLSHSGAVALLAAPEITGKLPRPLEIAARAIDPAELPASADSEPVPRDEGDLAQIVYTSGSTGQPKGVMLSHGNLRAGAEVVSDYLRISGEDRIAALLPFSFDYGLNQLWCSTAKAATLVVDRSPIAARIVRTLRVREVTVLACVPPLWLQLLQVEAFRSAPLPALRVMTNTGGRLPVEAVSELRACQPHAELVLMYGLTEAFRSTWLPPERVDDKPDSIGQGIPGAEVLVVREDGSECAPGEAGQLVHRGPTVALGYWNDQGASESVYRDGAVYSGDLVKRDEDGDLFFVGREDTLIKTLGYRVSPDEVAEVLYASGQVAEALVSSEPDRERGARIVAHVVLAAGGELGRLQEFAARELPRYMQPSRVEVHDALPRTASGKHDALAAARVSR
jgi:acyl-CoA synthetase (AMP-forming)/AMP-acid ligase II